MTEEKKGLSTSRVDEILEELAKKGNVTYISPTQMSEINRTISEKMVACKLEYQRKEWQSWQEASKIHLYSSAPSQYSQ